jgi:hypothetical protein
MKSERGLNEVMKNFSWGMKLACKTPDMLQHQNKMPKQV